MSQDSTIRIAPYQYIHVQDRNLNVTRLEKGPQNFTKKDNEIITTGKNPLSYVYLQPYHYCLISDPVIRDKSKNLVYDKHGQIKIRIGEQEIRTQFDYQQPFPLYPGEVLSKIEKLPVVPRDSAIKLEALRDFVDTDDKKKVAGDEWLEFGPKIYIPKVEVKIVEILKPITIQANQALKVRARRQTKDHKGNERDAGEEWLIRDLGFYYIGIDEILVDVVYGQIINSTTALLFEAKQTFTDVYGIERKAGEQWLITNENASVHVQDVHENYLRTLYMTILKEDEFCYILNPKDEKGQNQLGKKILVTGPKHFFLQPGEEITGGIQNVYLLGEDEALLLRAEIEHVDEDGVKRNAVERWMVFGPRRYVIPTEVVVLEKRRSIPLDSNEGIYVRDNRDGSIRAEIGKTYMLQAQEELWEMPLDDTVEQLLGFKGVKRDKTRLVTFKCPYNSAVRVYDNKSKLSRVEFGPSNVQLKPDEQFTVIYLSGGKPKKPGVIKTLHVGLGPDFFSDIFQVETSDHARLQLQLSYNWEFVFDKSDQGECNRIFNVKDFVGDACSAIASKVRGEVATLNFEQFHKLSARHIRKAIFGLDKAGKIVDRLIFKNNSLHVTNVDIQIVEPVDQKTKEQLQKLVTLAIEITTKMQEAEAKKQADKNEQEAKAALQKRKIEDEALAEKERTELYNLQSECESIKSTGQAKADAKVLAQKLDIEGKAQVEVAKLQAQAQQILQQSKLSYELAVYKHEKEKGQLELQRTRKLKELEIKKAKELGDIEGGKFKQYVECLGRETLVSLSKAGPELQAEILQSLGLQGYMIMDSNNPVNLFSSASGIVNALPKTQ